MSLESEFENQPFAVRRVVLLSRWRQGLTSLFNLMRLWAPTSPVPIGPRRVQTGLR